MHITLTRGDYEVDVDVDLSLAAFTQTDWMRVGFALGTERATALFDADPDTQAAMMSDERTLRAVVWAKLAPLLETKFGHEQARGWRPADLVLSMSADRKPDDALGLDELSVVTDG